MPEERPAANQLDPALHLFCLTGASGFPLQDLVISFSSLPKMRNHLTEGRKCSADYLTSPVCSSCCSHFQHSSPCSYWPEIKRKSKERKEVCVCVCARLRVCAMCVLCCKCCAVCSSEELLQQQQLLLLVSLLAPLLLLLVSLLCNAVVLLQPAERAEPATCCHCCSCSLHGCRTRSHWC